MSDYDPDSELSRLSKTAGQGMPVKVSEDLWKVLTRAEQLARKSGGAFDVTIGPVVQLWRKARREHRLPDADAIAAARRAVGFEKVRLHEDKTVEITAQGMKLDLGAIAKGYAADQALAAMSQLGVTHALVTGSGDMAAGDPPPGKKGWRIELSPLDATNTPATNHVLISNCGFATSGDLFQFVEIDGKRYSHIVDPQTGVGLTDHSLVVVIARDGMTADSLSTVISVLGPEKGFKLAENEGAVVQAARKISDKVEVFRSPKFSKYLE